MTGAQSTGPFAHWADKGNLSEPDFRLLMRIIDLWAVETLNCKIREAPASAGTIRSQNTTIKWCDSTESILNLAIQAFPLPRQEEAMQLNLYYVTSTVYQPLQARKHQSLNWWGIEARLQVS
ncbi:hypothetical protein HJG60_010641 [Phyllostomus discolor]|uniref:Uncharacterized protein n=1 Tax=Phyllostomus discolor TaxID=89673 RepID=A0A834EF02_9CHIR|nr:hypothetical protein HJG60_010641 [Phyllostomus discolor]